VVVVVVGDYAWWLFWLLVGRRAHFVIVLVRLRVGSRWWFGRHVWWSATLWLCWPKMCLSRVVGVL
jgi:hypothetical protein